MIKTILALIALTSTLFAKTNICVSIPPQAYFVKKIAGNQANVTVLVPPGASPATYTPRPTQMRAIKNASLYFTIGVPFEKNWLQRFKSVNPSMTIVDMTAGIHKRPMQHLIDEKTDRDHEHNHHHGNLDPHVWLSPALAKILAKNTLVALSKADPDHTALFKKNYHALLKKIETLQAQIRQKLDNLPQKIFIVFHPSFGYFADEFGLRQVAIEHEGKKPSLRYLKSVIDFAKKYHIKTVFTEPQFSRKSARYIAKQICGQVVDIDPLSEAWETNLLKIADSLEKASRHQR